MSLPFTTEQFLNVFSLYNNSIWPAQIFLNILAFAAVLLCFRPHPPSAVIAGILAALWVWTGSVYHMAFFSSINPAAYVFGSLALLQGAVLAYFGVIRHDIPFGFRKDISGYTGALFLAYALVAYPVLGFFLGHAYPASPTFGAPCPTTIFTFGILLWTAPHVRWYIVLLPLIWSIVGSSAAFSLGIREDIGLLVSGIAGTALLVGRRARTLNPAGV